MATTLASQVAGAKRPSQTITWLYGSGDAVDLTGATITGYIRSRAGATRDIAGGLVVIDAAAGMFRWDYHANDVATAGHYTVQFTATFAENPTPAKSLLCGWTVEQAISS